MLKKILALFVMLYAAVAMAAGVDVNKATDAQLDAVKGIGPVTTRAIVTERKKGDFRNWQDFIDRVKGVGDKKAEALSKEGLTVNGDSYKGAAATMAKDDKKSAKAVAKDETKDAKTTAKDEKKDAKATAKEEKRQAKAEAKAEKKEEKAEAKKAVKTEKKAAKASKKSVKKAAKAEKKEEAKS